jgi:hypothetical protein
MASAKKVTSILGVFVLGTMAGHHIDDFVEKYNMEVGRYPLQAEYRIIESCLKSDEAPLRRSDIEQKKDVCICALEKTEREYDFGAFKESQTEFLYRFEQNAMECL